MALTAPTMLALDAVVGMTGGRALLLVVQVAVGIALAVWFARRRIGDPTAVARGRTRREALLSMIPAVVVAVAIAAATVTGLVDAPPIFVILLLALLMVACVRAFQVAKHD